MAEAPQDERFVHRLEAFSDIVIGFSLAQLGATLVIRPASELIADPGWLFVFAWTFVLVCEAGWTHSRVFRDGFNPTIAAITCNFGILATIVLLVFFAQVFARSVGLHNGIIAARLYFGMLGLNYLATALLYRLGAAHKRRAVVIYGVSGVFLLGVVIAAGAAGDSVAVPSAMGCAVPVGFVIGRFIARRAIPAAPA